MASETINLPMMSSEINRPAGGHSRRKSTGGFLKTPTTGAEIMPNYLKTSTGSCHDVCKYGIKYEFETKPRTPFPRKYRANPDRSKYIGNGLYEHQANMMKPETSSKFAPKPMRQPTYNYELIKKELASPSKKIVVTPKRLSLPGKEISSLPKPESEIRPKIAETLKGRGLSASERLKTDAKPKVLAIMKGKETSALSRPANDNMPNVSEAFQGKGISALTKPATESKPNDSDTRASSNSIQKNLNKAYSGIVSAKRTAAVQLRSLAGSVSMKKGDTKTNMQLDITKLKKKNSQKVISLQKASSKTKRDLSKKSGVYGKPKEMFVQEKQSTGCKFETLQSSDENVPEKTLYVIEPEPENVKPSEENSLRSDQSKLKPKGSFTAILSESKQSVATTLFPTDTKMRKETSLYSDSDDAEIKIPIDDQKIEEKRMLRSAAIVSKDGDCVPGKLKFRAARLLDIQPSGNSSPRKLKFRPAKLLGEIQIGKADKVILKSRAKEPAKTTRRSSYNKIIKETASNLVKARKSKVKALVGAFESVISLQDSKKQIPMKLLDG